MKRLYPLPDKAVTVVVLWLFFMFMFASIANAGQVYNSPKRRYTRTEQQLYLMLRQQRQEIEELKRQRPTVAHGRPQSRTASGYPVVETYVVPEPRRKTRTYTYHVPEKYDPNVIDSGNARFITNPYVRQK